MVLSVVAIDKIGEGKIMPNDPGVYYDCEFRLLSFKPEMNEIVEGEAIDNTEFGAFVRMGPMDGLVHISQLIDDFVSFDAKNSVFLGKESKRTLKEGDMVRGRVISASFGSGENKVGLTMRQSGLGGMAWIEDDKRKMKLGGKAEKAEKPEKPKSEKKEKKE
jgi:DNA-directed RNA polymerase subunit E'